MKKAITIILALVFVLSMVPAAFAAESGPDTSNWTLVWDLETAPDNLSDWCSNKFADWGTVAVPDTWEPTTVAGKGVNGSKALCWHYKSDTWGTSTFIDISQDSGAKTDWTGATELMFYIDTTEIVNGEDNGGTVRLEIGLNASSLDKNVHHPNCVIYIWKDGAWVEQVANEYHPGVPVGYQGYVRIPLNTLIECPADLSSITKIMFWLENKWDIGKKVYYDNFMINVAPESGDTTPDAPTTGGDTSTDEPAKTGDGSLMIPAMLLATVSAACMVLVLKKKEF